MKRTNFVMKLVSALLFLALFAYLSVYVYRSYVNPLTTAPAVNYTIQETVSLDGIIVRQEQLIPNDYDIVATSVDEGDKVRAGQEIAVAYDTQEAFQRASQISALKQEISHLESYLDSVGLSDGATSVDSNIKQTIYSLNYAIGRGNLNDLDEALQTLSSLVLFSDQSTAEARLNSLRQELSQAGSVSSGQTSTISASEPGVFSAVADGFEQRLSPDMLTDISAESLEQLMGTEQTASSRTVGKLITDINWYFAVVLKADEAAKLKEKLGDKQQVSVLFNGMGTNSYEMQIQRIGSEEENGNCVVVLSCNRFLTDTLDARLISGEIICASYTGIRIPKEAVYREDGDKAFVYTLTDVRAEKKYITILYEMSDYYLVEPTGTNVLREGNAVIVSAKDLYDGKVVVR